MILHGDCLLRLKELADNSVDSVVTDPPYGLSAVKNSGKTSKGGFMGKLWDYDVPSVDIWKECLRVLKPGGHMLVACGTRTQHRMVVNIEDAGFEIRDVITWLYGSGYPKSQNISIAIDKSVGVLGHRGKAFQTAGAGDRIDIQNTTGAHAFDKHIPITDAAKQWEGWGSALKPAVEFFTLCRKPLSESTIAKNVLKWGTGGINVDGTRIVLETGIDLSAKQRQQAVPDIDFGAIGLIGKEINKYNKAGRFPANLILDEEAAAALDEQSWILKSGAKNGVYKNNLMPDWSNKKDSKPIHLMNEASEGGASRFFYCAKSSKSDRGQNNSHPTVKPTKLMEYLCKLITPPGGTVLDPFMGSGSTGVAAIREGFQFIGIEREAEYVEIATRRIEAEKNKLTLFNAGNE